VLARSDPHPFQSAAEGENGAFASTHTLDLACWVSWPMILPVRNSATVRRCVTVSVAPCSFINPDSSDRTMLSGDMRRNAEGAGARVSAELSWQIWRNVLVESRAAGVGGKGRKLGAQDEERAAGELTIHAVC
jgi:hypothetical protein